MHPFKLAQQVTAHQSDPEGAFISKADFERLVRQTLLDEVNPSEASTIVGNITDRVFGLLDLCADNERCST